MVSIEEAVVLQMVCLSSVENFVFNFNPLFLSYPKLITNICDQLFILTLLNIRCSYYLTLLIIFCLRNGLKRLSTVSMKGGGLIMCIAATREG